MSTIRYWLWLSEVRHVSAAAKLRLLEHFGTPERAFFAADDELESVEGLSRTDKQYLRGSTLGEADVILADCDRLSISLLTYQDAAYPRRLKSVDDPPLVLYYRGRLPDFDHEAAIGVVGTRSASAYGLLTAKKMGYQIAKAGGLVVSGLAAGIDSRAIEGALSAGAAAVGVLGCGVNIVYPRENAALFEDVAAAGALISEYPPGTKPEAKNFPARNRIISALCLGVLVVEAPAKSGALITAGLALEQGRDVFAVPGNIDVASSEGSNRLLREGAICVSSGWDVMGEYADAFPDKIDLRAGIKSSAEGYMGAPPNVEWERKKVAETVKLVNSDDNSPQPGDKKTIDKPKHKAYIDLNEIKDGLSPDEILVAQTLCGGPRHVDEVIEAVQLSASRVLATLTLLEVKGYAQQLPGKRFSLTEV